MTHATPNLCLITPEWPTPDHVKSLQTTRVGGFSVDAYLGLNLGSHVGDDALNVAKNRQLLQQVLPAEPVWLNQVHGVGVVDASRSHGMMTADAAFSRQANVVCVVMTADCLPILLCDRQGKVVAAVHAGWRSLCAGVIEATVKAMQAPADELMVWMGPAIGPDAFEVGAEVREQLMMQDPQAEQAFKAGNQPHKWKADIYSLARLRLQAIGVTQLYGGSECTYSDSARYYSYRRDGVTGRMASFIWLTA